MGMTEKSFDNKAGNKSHDAIEKLVASRTKYLNLIRNSPDIIYVLDSKGNFLLVEGALEKILGYTREELVGKHFSLIVHPEDRERAQFRFNERRTGKRATTGLELRLVTKKGRGKPFESTCITIELNAFGLYEKPIDESRDVFVGTYGIARDITRQKRAEKGLLESKQVLQSIFDGIPDPMILVRRDLTVKRLNVPALRHFRLSGFENALDKPCYEGLRKRKTPCVGCRVPSEIKRLKRLSSLSFEQSDPLNSEKKYLISLYPINTATEQGNIIIHFKDITRTRILERRMIQNEKMASLGFLISGIAHEINNPNNFISFNIPILKDYIQKLLPIVDVHANRHPTLEFFGMPYSEFRQDLFRLLDNLQHGTERISKTVSALKEFTSSSEEIEFKRVNLKNVLEKAITFCRKKVERMVKTFEVDFSGSDIPIVTFPGGLEQIIINFIINAAQASDKKDSFVKVGVKKGSDKKIIIEVIDNGKGISGSMLDKIFDPFFSTKPSGQGTGLGLTICQTLAENMGAEIRVQSNLGEGSIFSLILPPDVYKGLEHGRQNYCDR